ncbi:Proprotein convertase subtilisin/kexin type 5 [Mytilus edulis]|uniref:Proprotein convertase subtilisin/kexin type 5 n=1 Tax=Mytilus edulis TaxID=6550 RepID=A0A8S3RXN5_MYTED|nr:Proprotein convertase subtilisin/kexin type 5 [Mytilus edulis]
MASTRLIVLIILVNRLQSNQFELNNTDDIINRESSLDLEQNPESTDIIIKLQPDGTEEDIQNILSRYPKFKLSKQFELFGETYYKFSFDESKIPKLLVDGTVGLNEDDNDILRMTNEKKVKFVDIDRKEIVMTYADTANPDPELTDMWHLNGVMRYTHRIEEVWALGYTGKGIKVGVIDTLMQTNHIDLTNMDESSSYDYYNDDNDPNPPDSTLYHGTTVAGVIGATKGNNYCAVGVAYNTTLVAIGLLGSITPVLSDSQFARSLSHMYDTIDIYCNSYGSKGQYNYSVLGPMRRAAFENSARYTSTTINSGCRDGLQGTSYAAPIAVGIIALALEANNDLTWRDVQHLIVRTSKRYGFRDRFEVQNRWQRTGAGLWVHHRMGFGLMNAADMVKKAIGWKTVPEQLTWQSQVSSPNMILQERSKARSRIYVSRYDCPIRYLEHVMATVSFDFSCCRGAVEVYLISPSGTKVVLLPQRIADALVTATISDTFTWTYKVVHLWGENPIGKWKVLLKLNSMIARGMYHSIIETNT